MNPWFLLLISIAAEICGTTALKYSDGFSKPLPTIISLSAFGLALFLMSIVYRSLPVGLVYAIWSGAGIVLTAIIAYFAFGQKPDLAGFIGMAMIVGGVLVINLFSKATVH
ncbi:MAG: multidrug efflux SMR transporter [Pasteurellaceae bacterium]|nr:multidrug efflux SMR transporter [Pasteurellaceae bacterium]